MSDLQSGRNSFIFIMFLKENPPLDEAAADESPKWPHLPTPDPVKAGLFSPKALTYAY
jgi:hypothetical protein